VPIEASAGSPDAAVAPDGTVVMVWTTAGGSVRAAARAPGGAFSGPQTLGSGITPRVAVGGNGHAVAVWEDGGEIRAAARPPGGGFGALGVISDADNASQPDVAMNGFGVAAAAWNATGKVRIKVRPATGGAFGSAQEYTTPALTPRVAMANNGNGVIAVVWEDNVAVRVEGAIRFSNGVWNPVDELGVAAAGAAPVVAVDSTGNTSAVWRDGANALQWAGRPPGNPGFGSAQPLDAGGAIGSPDVAADGVGTMVAVWTRANVVRSAVRAAQADFTAPGSLSSPGFSATAAKVAMNRQGKAMAAWRRFDPGLDVAQAAFRPAGGSFEPATDVSQQFQNTSDPAVGLDATGNAAAAFRYGNTMHYAGFDGAPPVLTGLSAPGGGMALRPLAFAASASDVWTAVSTSWSFGDGQSAAGPAVQHTYGAAGTFGVTVTLADGAANATSAALTLPIGPPDADGDGFTDGQDCDDANPAIRPGAIEVRGNSVDENCDGLKAPFLTINAGLRYSFDRFPNFLRLTALKLKGFPRNSRVKATCRVKKKKCPGRARKALTKKRARGTVNMRKRFVGVRLRPGTVIRVTVTKSRYIGDVKILRIRKGKNPTLTDRCLRPGSRKVRKRC